jgi:hypothetical protein
MRRSLDHSGKHKFRGRLPCGTAVLSAAEVAPDTECTGTGEGQGVTFAIRVERAAIHERRDVGRQRASLKAQAYDSRDGAGMPQESDGTFGMATTRTAPEMVVEVSYAEWTPDGLLRHVVYLGEREDKPAIEVRRDPP